MLESKAEEKKEISPALQFRIKVHLCPLERTACQRERGDTEKTETLRKDYSRKREKSCFPFPSRPTAAVYEYMYIYVCLSL